MLWYLIYKFKFCWVGGCLLLCLFIVGYCLSAGGFMGCWLAIGCDLLIVLLAFYSLCHVFVLVCLL